MENIKKNTPEENRRIVQQGLDRRAEARAQDEYEARMDAFESDMINICNESAARRRKQQMEAQEAKKAQEAKNASAVMEDPKAVAEREKALIWKQVKDSFFVVTSYCTFLLLLRIAEDFGAPLVAIIHLAAIATVMAIAGVITMNRSAFRIRRKRRAAR